ncbi:hypothetical protein J31TS6_19350 [Brevibacillus reuszeri]|uniref:alpha/beta hydrolase family protein n=1 Tax=Brevibacillus reuszeri TaxID=54915 RepID=UPI001B2496D4|nr:hypothetical protein [Brevibacillus reuszeri]GIO05907.1 hypothetical protein J31TS6_19350 [Brevibacillus reuszeri]
MKRIELPRPAGNYPVGLRHTSYPFSIENISTPISLTIYYPAVDGAGAPAAYAFPQVLEPMGLDRVNTRCVKDAALSGDGPFPLLIFSHGYLTYEMSNTLLCTDLASFGYVVASIGHTGEASVMLPDGTYIPKEQKYIDYVYEPQMLDMAEKLLNEVARVQEGTDFENELAELAAKFHAIHNGNLNDSADIWERHTLKAAEYLYTLNADPTSFLYRGVDFTKGIGLGGHSFGGATAANCCAAYDLFACGINIDGAQLGSSFGKDIGKPFMTFSGTDGGRILRDMYWRNSADAYRISISNVGHIGFTDRGIIGKLAGKVYPDVGEKDPEQVRAILCDLHLSFFKKYLMGEKIEIQAPDDVDVEFQLKPGWRGGRELSC